MTTRRNLRLRILPRSAYSAVVGESFKSHCFQSLRMTEMEVEASARAEDDEFIQKQIELEQQAQVDEALKIRSRKWQQKRVKKFKQESKGRLVSMQNSDMPVEQLRKIVKDHGDMSSRKFRNDKRIYLGALK